MNKFILIILLVFTPISINSAEPKEENKKENKEISSILGKEISHLHGVEDAHGIWLTASFKEGGNLMCRKINGEITCTYTAPSKLVSGKYFLPSIPRMMDKSLFNVLYAIYHKK